ncbi:MAG: Uma2 family endonuclease [Myxococcales bacterium]|nr:Uma2 family endonuclease [Myxococcales bacterium]
MTISELARFHLGYPPPGIDELVCDDGEPMESSRHREQMILLIHTLRDHLSFRSDVYIGGNEFLYFSETQARNNDFRGPDVFVVLGVEPGERKAWVTWLEGGKTPDVVIELSSVSTWEEDYGHKQRVYAQRLGVKEYFVYDPFSGQLDGFSLAQATREYQSLAPNSQGRLPVTQLGLELGVLPGDFQGSKIPWLRWFTPDGRPLATSEEKLADERQRVQLEKQRADAERQYAEAEKQRAEAEKQRAEAEKQRAEAEKRRADLEAAARAEAEERIRVLEAKLAGQRQSK